MIKAYAIQDMKTGRLYDFMADKDEADKIMAKNKIFGLDAQLIEKEFQSVDAMTLFNTKTRRRRHDLRDIARIMKKDEDTVKQVKAEDYDETPTEELDE